MSSHGCFLRKMKMESKEEEEMLSTPWLNQTTLKRDKTKKDLLWSPTPNLKFLRFRPLLEKKMRKDKCVFEGKGFGKVYDFSHSLSLHRQLTKLTIPFLSLKAHSCRPKHSKNQLITHWTWFKHKYKYKYKRLSSHN